jgi:hypothetical protein
VRSRRLLLAALPAFAVLVCPRGGAFPAAASIVSVATRRPVKMIGTAAGEAPLLCLGAVPGVGDTATVTTTSEVAVAVECSVTRVVVGQRPPLCLDAHRCLRTVVVVVVVD